MHFPDPVVETVHDEPPHDGVVGVEGVAAAGVVGIARSVGFQHVVEIVAQPAVAEGGPPVIAFGGMVEHHVEDHLHAGSVERLHHVAELVQGAERIGAGAVGRMGSKEGERAVAPVVGEAKGGIVRVELEDRQEFDGGDAQILQVGNLLDQAGVGAALVGRDP